MSDLIERLRWTIHEHRDDLDDNLLKAIIREMESTHRIVDPEVVTEEMLDACFAALPEHYDPPDPRRRLWHAFKAKRRYTAMVKTSKKLLCTD